MNKLPFRKVLALSPHTDDIEFGCGGFLSRLQENGAEIHSAVFSDCHPSLPEGMPDDTLIHEMHLAAEILKIPKNNRHIFYYPVRRFPEHRQDILENLVSLKNKIQPDLVLIPSSKDVHQDHEVINREGVRAFRFTSVLGYELIWNNPEFPNQMVIELNEEHMQIKSDAISCYKSQSFRSYAQPDLFNCMSGIRGIQNKVKLAETFEVIKLYF